MYSIVLLLPEELCHHGENSRVTMSVDEEDFFTSRHETNVTN
jgi:hypothetical protein